MTKPNTNILYLGILLLAVLIAAYANHFNNGFHFDDSHAVVDNIHIRDLKNIPQFFTDPKMFSSDPLHWGLRPIVTTTLAIDYWLGGGLTPFYFQLSTFSWFVLLGIMLYFMYRNLLVKSINHNWIDYIALGATAWYILNTANAETVNYIISRSDVISTTCIVASFLIYIAYPQKRKFGLYILPAIIGVFTKETVLVLIILLFFYIILFENELSVGDLFKSKNFKNITTAIWLILPLIVLVVFAQYYTLSKIKSISGITNPFLGYVLTQAWVWLHYFISFFLPLNLSADTDLGVISNIFDERIILGLIFVVALIVTIFKTSSKKETKPIAFGLIWFAASLLPTSLAPFAEVTNDHRMFFPFIGLSFSVVTYIGLRIIKIEKKITSNQSFRTALGICIFLILGLNAYGIHQRDKVWNNDESLWYDVTIKSPLNGRGLMNYGLTQMGKGNYTVAEQYFEKAEQYLPYYNTLFINMGILAGASNRPVDADADFKKAISLSPNTYDSYAFYARYLKSFNRDAEAIPMAQKALQINPYSVIALQVLMGAYNDLSQWDSLKQVAQQTLAILPNDTGAKNYLKAATQRQSLTTNTIISKPLSAADYLNMSVAYYNQQNYQKCIEACKMAISLKSDDADAYSNMGAAYNQLKQWKQGIAACEMALKINPNHKLATGNLEWAKKELNTK
ncbi:tetratricopeptide repeat protein [Mucilaginibacter sp.]